MEAAGGEEPITRILLLLGASVGLPYFLLASTSPLLQAWFVRARPGGNPYRLFAVSNLASLLALVGYPFVVEPVFTAREQVIGWSLAVRRLRRPVRGRRLADSAARVKRAEDAPEGNRRKAAVSCCGSRCRPPARRCCSRSPTT